MAEAPPPDLVCPIQLPEDDRTAFVTALAAHATHFLTGDFRHFGAYFGKKYGEMLVQSPAVYVATMKRERA